MADTTSIRVYEGDKKRIKDMASAADVKIADVVAKLLREPMFRCPECGERFEASEVDAETVREHGALTNRMDKLLKGEREVKDFECPTCNSRIKPKDVEEADATERDGATREELGVTSENENPEFSTEEA